MPTGGEWKELLRASRDGDIKLIQYHLDQGVNPNWQHPEYFTAPIFESIRKNRTEAVEVLLEGGADPLLIEEMTDCQPLEVALQEEKHGIVDLLSSRIPQEEVIKHVKTILLSGTTNKQMIQHLLGSGNRLYVLIPEKDETEDMRTWMDETGNKKWSIIHQLESVGGDICTWIHYCPHDGQNLMVDDISSSSRLANVRNVKIKNHQPKQESFLSQEAKHTCILVEPNGLWYRLTYFWWYEKYLETLLMVATAHLDGVRGKVFDYQGVCFG
uniref:Uncharacterized protein n=1 Tax=Ditylum brightwellii TaxID=49249 RepID=A0A7S2EJ53_9STRA|mmetsp:Transcript_31339/g.46780  ORF Transcript_31339/g.46780 Transcript_31339/m.46780 type:complete len:270 (+) Transcript_31339:32-841(+)